MARSLQEHRRSAPLAAYNFRVSIDGMDMRFAKVSGLAREYHTVTYRDGLSFLEGERISKFYIDAFAPITLEQGTVLGDGFLAAWLEQPEPRAVWAHYQNPVTSRQGGAQASRFEWLARSTLSSMEISLCDERGLPVVAWSIAKAVPIKLTAPTFDAATNQLAIDSLEIQAAGITIKHLA